ncbi:hypothetical protein GQ55_5G212600 [Panicum hallii var. hallii]|uniref:Homeobox domain-containing protein n=1 Tax=Panicum hallii var. hallii TaxID=1504633 RepID=A0A2T7DIP6_9POAL|nr:hypothetical protein GQ55_5G212600 [Panicum hallii var. hallii]
MASSFNNRHWPSMFRSKHAAEPWQAQPDISGSPPSFLSGGVNTTSAAGSGLKHPSSGYAGGEERTPDPKPRWNPRPEQIRILEAIFNSGMVNPPRDEIPRIRMRLQEYGQVGDANVFYWFQNRKSRSKNKLRTAGTARPCATRAPARGTAVVAPVTAPPAVQASQQLLTQQVQLLASPAQAPTSSSSSSSDRSSGSSRPAAKRAAQEMSPMAEMHCHLAPMAAMDLLGPLAATCPQMYYQGQPVAPASAPAHKVQDLVSSDEPIFQPWPQGGYCLSAAEVAAILGGQNMHVPVQEQPAASLPAGAFLGLCNKVAGSAITGQRTCAWGSGLGQYCPGGGGADPHQVGLGKNTTAAPNTVGRGVAHEDATKLGLLQYCFGDSTAVDPASVAATSPLAATPDAAATVASVAAATTAGLTGLPANIGAPNGVVASYDLLQLQGLAADGALGVGAVTTSGAAAPAAAAPAGAHAQQQEGGVAALCVTDTATGKSVAHAVAAARLDVRAQFGDAAVLFRCAGERGLDIEQVPVDASGRTVQPLQHGAFYYVLV